MNGNPLIFSYRECEWECIFFLREFLKHCRLYVELLIVYYVILNTFRTGNNIEKNITRSKIVYKNKKVR